MSETEPHDSACTYDFSDTERARLLAYRAAVVAGFFTDADVLAATREITLAMFRSRASADASGESNAPGAPLVP
jgi:hypothetical protein